MKTTILSILIITIFGCQNSRWPEKERNQFLASCVKSGMQSGATEIVAKEYCECVASKLEKKVSSPVDADMKLVFKTQEDCVKEISGNK